jgi:hypothetical protein
MRGISIYRDCSQAYPEVHKPVNKSCTNLNAAKSANKRAQFFKLMPPVDDFAKTAINL